MYFVFWMVFWMGSGDKCLGIDFGLWFLRIIDFIGDGKRDGTLTFRFFLFILIQL